MCLIFFVSFYSFPRSRVRRAVPTCRGDYQGQVEAHVGVTVDGRIARHGGDDRPDAVRRWTNAVR